MDKIKEQILKTEQIYKEYAMFNKDAIRFKVEIVDRRLEFQRDCDRIIHSLTYTRYTGKTQVFSNITNDHISMRMVHVQFVSKAARSIARALGLNEDLCEAIALGHDVGHTPYGHVGETILDKISQKYLGERFMHNVQSVRSLMYLEKNGTGLNLTLQVLDGILCHNGEKVQENYYPMEKNKEEFLNEYNSLYKNPELLKSLRPMTLEGCVARISDIIGYIGKDIEDAIRLGTIKREDIPKDIENILGNTNQKIMDTIIKDIVENSFDKKCISMSKEVYEALYKLKDFNRVNIYKKQWTKEKIEMYAKKIEKLFNMYKNALILKDVENDIYSNYLKSMNDDYKQNTKVERIVMDFIAGMTDRYINMQYEKYFNEKLDETT